MRRWRRRKGRGLRVEVEVVESGKDRGSKVGMQILHTNSYAEIPAKTQKPKAPF
jgi:hypothetical protein